MKKRTRYTRKNARAMQLAPSKYSTCDERDASLSELIFQSSIPPRRRRCTSTNRSGKLSTRRFHCHHFRHSHFSLLCTQYSTRALKISPSRAVSLVGGRGRLLHGMIPHSLILRANRNKNGPTGLTPYIGDQ